MAEKPNYELVRERLRRTRQQRDLTLRQAEEESGVGAATLSRIERGATTPDTATLDKLIDWLELERHDVYNASRVIPESTPEAVSAILRADPQLDSKTVQALGAIFETAYAQFATPRGKSGK
jgi:transcriptional regulator with XRE-family HTH domain